MFYYWLHVIEQWDVAEVQNEILGQDLKKEKILLYLPLLNYQD